MEWLIASVLLIWGISIPTFVLVVFKYGDEQPEDLPIPPDERINEILDWWVLENRGPAHFGFDPGTSHPYRPSPGVDWKREGF